MNLNDPVLASIRDGRFRRDDFTLQALSYAFNEVRAGYIDARRLRRLDRKQAALADLHQYSRPILGAIAKKWAEKGLSDLKRKIDDLERKENDLDRSLNPYDAVLLDLLRKELAQKSQGCGKSGRANGATNMTSE